ncbi:transcriptional regulator BetI, partial [Stenotrophomonas maltophilia]
GRRGLAASDRLASWLRGSLVGGQFNAEKSRRIAYGYIDFQLQAAAL